MHRIPASLQALAVDAAPLRPYPRNPRNGDIEAIAESLRAHGQYRPIVVRTGSNEVLAGNHTLHAALSLGWTQIAVTFVDVDDDEAARIVLVDNRTNDLASYNESELADLLQSLPDLTGSGYDAQALDDLLASVARDAQSSLRGDQDPDMVPDVPQGEPVTKCGDRILLGTHVLVCGDSTNGDDVARLLQDEPADMVWTDPPYGISYVGKTADALTIENDTLTEESLAALLRDSLTIAWSHSRAGASWYVAAPAGPLHLVFAVVLRDLSVWRQTLQWVKHAFVFGRSDYHYRHEPIFYGWKEGAAHFFVDDRTQDTIWEIDRPMRSTEHPTMKPVELVARAIRNSTKPGALVLDPFGGSGTTLIACEQEGRVARLMEIDPKYCDVIVERWQNFSGQKAQRPVDARITAGT